MTKKFRRGLYGMMAINHILYHKAREYNESDKDVPSIMEAQMDDDMDYYQAVESVIRYITTITMVECANESGIPEDELPTVPDGTEKAIDNALYHFEEFESREERELALLMRECKRLVEEEAMQVRDEDAVDLFLEYEGTLPEPEHLSE